MSGSTRALPDQPDFDQLRRQAKELLAAYRAGQPDAVAEVRRHYADPLPDDFALSHAQLVLARSYGFESWAKLKGAVDSAAVARLCRAAAEGDLATIDSLLARRPELAGMDTHENDEQRALHHAVLGRQVAAVGRLLVAGADPHQGIYPERPATTALAMARDRGYTEIVATIEAHDERRRAELSCPNLTVTPDQDRLHKLVRDGDEAAAIALLEADLELAKACDRGGASVLHIAAEHGREQVAEWVIARRIGLAKPDADGRPPVDRALLRTDMRRPELLAARERIARRLLAAGVPVTPVAAAAVGDVAALRRFRAEDPSSVNRPDLPSGGLLSIAVRHHQPEALEVLLGFGLDPDERKRLGGLAEEVWSWGQPLWWAAVGGRYAMAERLLAAGADPRGQVYASGDPMFCAYTARDEPMKALLKRAGGRADCETLGLYGDADGVRERLAEEGSNPDIVYRLLWGASCGGWPNLVAAILEHLDLPPEDPSWHWLLSQPIRFWGDSPWQMHRGPAYADYPRCLKLMLDHGGNPNAANRHQQRLLHDCCPADRGSGTEPYRAEMAAMLLEAGADPTVRDKFLQSTPLGWAARWGQRRIVDLLLERGAPAHEPDAEPWAQPLAWAERMGHGEIADRLRAAGA